MHGVKKYFGLRATMAALGKYAGVALLLALVLGSTGCSFRKSAGVQTDEPRLVCEPEYGQQDLHTQLLTTARKSIGTRYKSGGMNPSTGFDCSGYMMWVYSRSGIKLPRTSKEQMLVGRAVNKKDLRVGDIVCFRISRRTTHTGMYTGNGMFIHSPSAGKKVSETPLNDAYWVKKYLGARRIKQLEQ